MRKFGEVQGGKPVYEIGLKLPSGVTASIISFGAIVRDLKVPLADGSLRRVVLGFPDFTGYLADASYFGAIVGRNANRIAGGAFRLDGIEYRLARNLAGRDHLHGGPNGFSRQVWLVAAHDESSVTLALASPDDEEGYPGTVMAQCEYRLREPATLSVRLAAQTNAPTLVNLAHHSYFNLANGAPSDRHLLQLRASRYTPFDANDIPTGEIASVADTPYDFRKIAPISARMQGVKLDMNFVLDRTGDGLQLAGVVEGPDRMLRLEVHTTEPGIQVYDGSNMKPQHPGLDGAPYLPKAGFCLEPQKFPDAINHPNFPSPVLRPGMRYAQHTEYRFQALAP
jgi:aldose 1-epimerase